MKIKVLALDLEGTLISSAYTQIARPGLFDFLEFVTRNFERVALFTCVDKAMCFTILRDLSSEGFIPREFLMKIEYIDWYHYVKDLSFVKGVEISEVLIIDDNERFIKPDQRGQWMSIDQFCPLVDEDDSELPRIRVALERFVQDQKLKQE